jgi:hypothetical protein
MCRFRWVYFQSFVGYISKVDFLTARIERATFWGYLDLSKGGRLVREPKSPRDEFRAPLHQASIPGLPEVVQVPLNRECPGHQWHHSLKLCIGIRIFPYAQPIESSFHFPKYDTTEQGPDSRLELTVARTTRASDFCMATTPIEYWAQPRGYTETDMQVRARGLCSAQG